MNLVVDFSTLALSVEAAPAVELSIIPQDIPLLELAINPVFLHVLDVSGSGGKLEPLRLAVTQRGQMIWNLGGSEPRRTVYLGGLMLTENVHYTLALPYLTLLTNLDLTTTDFLTLT